MTKSVNQDSPELSEKEELNKMLFDSVKAGSVEMPMLLIGLGADVNYKENGVSVLGAAMISGSHVLIPFLTYLSNPETKRVTVEVNRIFAERLEYVIPSLQKMIENMGQSKENILASEANLEKAKKMAELKKEEEKKKEQEEVEKKQKEQIDDFSALIKSSSSTFTLENLVKSAAVLIDALISSPQIEPQKTEEKGKGLWVEMISSGGGEKKSLEPKREAKIGDSKTSFAELAFKRQNPVQENQR